jgi:hypothetical protein
MVIMLILLQSTDLLLHDVQIEVHKPHKMAHQTNIRWCITQE